MAKDATHALVHTLEQIEDLLRRGLAPLTDNRAALIALGFERAYPQVARGYDSTIWERDITLPGHVAGRRMLARQRAYILDRGT